MSTQHASQRPTRTQGAPRSRRAGSSRPAAGTPGAVGSTRASSTGGSTGASRASTRAHSGRTRTARLEPVTASQSVVRPASTAASHGGKRTSTNASRVPSSVRAAARTEETREEKPKQRNPLSTVRRRARKLSPPTMLAVFAAIPLTLIFILLLNVLIVTRQYDMVDLRAQEQQLVQENQALQQEIGFKEAPQDLAIRASTLGMFVSSSQATLNLQSSTIEGTPAPVASPTGAEGNKQENLIAPPAAGSNESYAKGIVEADKSVQQRHSQASASAKASASASASPTQQANTNQQANPAQPAPSPSASPAASAAPNAAQQPAASPAAGQAAR
ncbi:MAG: amino acid ABC transporter ATPase [Rothia mucilaginosa]|uniref:Amino acid ABC transporter ATPase n=1 Tax=Rothia mucilaginosa TaxID=43675 RepID=A0A930PQC0_9MICC|nr:amino acid ABC transporter ATPase [Rothia mucilaginosa]MBF1658274.1 amino acid ABC transporter ATPase [Rothia mucilaginosa]